MPDEEPQNLWKEEQAVIRTEVAARPSVITDVAHFLLLFGVLVLVPLAAYLLLHPEFAALDVLPDDWYWIIPAVLIILTGLCLITGIGLLRLAGWARPWAVALMVLIMPVCYHLYRLPAWLLQLFPEVFPVSPGNRAFLYAEWAFLILLTLAINVRGIYYLLRRDVREMYQASRR